MSIQVEYINAETREHMGTGWLPSIPKPGTVIDTVTNTGRWHVDYLLHDEGSDEPATIYVTSVTEETP